MDKKIIANWKMNGSLDSIEKYLIKIKDNSFSTESFVFAPPYPYLSASRSYVKNIAAQNFELFESLTGEVSPESIKDVGCNHVILGHAERRKKFNETDDNILLKAQKCITLNIKPIICIIDFKSIDIIHEIIDFCIIAYEPIYAIGTGKAIDKDDLYKIYSDFKNSFPNSYLAYGGSVDSTNVNEFLKITDGLLIGKASLNADFIINVLNNCTY